MILGKLICRMLGHKWRKLTVKEFLLPAGDIPEPITTPRSQLRICRRCGAERIAKQRKKEGPK